MPGIHRKFFLLALPLLAWSVCAVAAEAPQTFAERMVAGKSFWAFQPIRKAPAPDLQDPWCSGDVDRSILARLREKQLAPAPPADKATLIRRATLDLIGLLPTPEEIDAFEKDIRAEAFATVVDRLLASPHYGERWGRYWLDLARYSDDEGNSFLTPAPDAYIYRDWVIRALNNDMPYNQFVRLQLAGDLIPDATADYVERLGGLGFQGLGPKFRKGAAGEAKAKADELEDRIDTVSRGLMALTVSCARCHDHKFDPIPTRDYYSLASAYNGAQWEDRVLGPAEVVAQIKQRVQDATRQKEKVDKWPAEQGKRIGRDELARLNLYLIGAWQVQIAQQKQLKVGAGSVAREMQLRPYFLQRLVNWLKTDKPSPLLPQWKASTDQFAASAIVTNGMIEVPSELRETADVLGAQIAETLRPTALDASRQSMLKTWWQDADAPFAVPENEAASLFTDSDRKTLEMEKAELVRLQTKPASDPPSSPSVSGGGDPMHIYVRGNPEQPGDAAPPGFLTILRTDASPAGKGRFTRLDLADAIVSPTNPLTARVFVNRVWHYHFGRGIVGSLGNFGARGDLPTHPELLDNLTARFIESGWSTKWLHRQIMLSSTYQLSGTPNADNLTKDAENHYLWRFAPRRLDVEAWRDAMLAVAGKLNPQMGGPALDVTEPGEKAPGFPAFIRLRGAFADDPNNGRRSVYCIVSRYAPTLTMTMFDFPEPNVASDHRNVTTIPQQQLFVLNSPFMLAISKGFAARLQAAAPADDARIALAWKLAYGRSVTPVEASRCRTFLQLAADPSDKLTPWEQLSQAILSTNEFTFLR